MLAIKLIGTIGLAKMDCSLHTEHCSYHLLEITIPAFFLNSKVFMVANEQKEILQKQKQKFFSWLLTSLPLFAKV